MRTGTGTRQKKEVKAFQAELPGGEGVCVGITGATTKAHDSLIAAGQPPRKGRSK